MEFHFLGTGSGLPSKSRNVSGLAVRFLQRKSAQWLFDCGEATQHQLLNSTITPSKIERIFITHMHGDHIFGLPGLLSTRSAQGARSRLTIYGPQDIRSFVESSLKLSQSYLAYPIDYVVTEEGIVFSDDAFTVEAIKLDHVIPSFAYRITEQDKPGTLDICRLKDEGVAPGPIYQQIKNGETVTLQDGRVLEGSDYVGDPKPGRVIVIAGDTRPVKNLIAFAKHADLLIHEGTFSGEMKKHAQEYGHSTISDVAGLAFKAEVKKLILTHISSRYMDAESLEKEARAIFPSSTIAYDMMMYTL